MISAANDFTACANAMAKHGLSQTGIWDGANNVRPVYGIKAVPDIYLINKEGMMFI